VGAAQIMCTSMVIVMGISVVVPLYMWARRSVHTKVINVTS
jgi:hypothetical protein